jgi:hypothetical protein
MNPKKFLGETQNNLKSSISGAPFAGTDFVIFSVILLAGFLIGGFAQFFYRRTATEPQ